MLYFSGHGAQATDENGDETDDQADEVLVMHEANVQNDKLSGVLVDDRLYELLKQIPAKETLVLIDACNSGTVTKSIRLRSLRSGVSEGVSKFLSYDGMPNPGGKEIALAEKGAGNSGSNLRFVGLSAAADDELAVATERGSLFTRAVAQVVDSGIKGIFKSRGAMRVKNVEDSPTTDGASGLTLEQVQAGATTLIAQYVSEDGKKPNPPAHHPQLSGNLDLARKPLPVRASSPGAADPAAEKPSNQGVERNRWIQLAQSAPGRLQARILEPKLEEGDLLKLEVEVPDKKGYLNLVQVDPDDNVQVLFPNKMDQDNAVGAGTHRLPGNRAFDLVIREPFGSTVILAFYTRRPMNLFEASNGERDQKGSLLDTFPPIDSATGRSAVADPSLYAAALEFVSCLDKRCCR